MPMASTKKPVVESCRIAQKMLPQSFRVGAVYPLLKKLRALKLSCLDPAIEATSLTLGAFLAKLTLRLPDRSAKALGAVDENAIHRVALAHISFAQDNVTVLHEMFSACMV